MALGWAGFGFGAGFGGAGVGWVWVWQGWHIGEHGYERVTIRGIADTADV
ncbi:hypothetical protein GCM10009733_027340 [Nonomuraea maheshkhaliensis]|uniref:Uncharacterized protein n=1 Tax=Nonomuraea maheshkhaliensis TaxID=419590 RepID=A0ABP4R3X3_9ACTN